MSIVKYDCSDMIRFYPICCFPYRKVTLPWIWQGIVTMHQLWHFYNNVCAHTYNKINVGMFMWDGGTLACCGGTVAACQLIKSLPCLCTLLDTIDCDEYTAVVCLLFSIHHAGMWVSQRREAWNWQWDDRMFSLMQHCLYCVCLQHIHHHLLWHHHSIIA